jgi:hypothetical protein
MTNQTPTRNTGNCSPVKQLYQKLDFWKNRIFLWGARSGVHLFSDPQTQMMGQKTSDKHTQSIGNPLPKI